MGDQPVVQQYMGFGSPIDDLVESGTLRLLDWNDSMTDIQLDMRFVDKVQAKIGLKNYDHEMRKVSYPARMGVAQLVLGLQSWSKSQGSNPGSGSVGISISPMWEVVPCAHQVLTSSLQDR
ncbi:hypothetical protein M9H77_27596 [Catharanthus roseus]|uniref:Uncharacterized protein n=1 Tax=Catharanthus roseus TaxID=4058 RepID=A0ACC0AFN9_CATRO|nr:hypothetical protein M9H77_27596 [Catharanthus roseus]